ncbi:Vacuolar protein sorting-associated protein 4B [Zootermopsis nevadensis]|uniref:Vacuolar protein sorting-associated protein 4B n=1 Tax=Zootermopsis nevadensis TaxID=136037 RepID=A0A067RDV5_ZOONE|nr:Vacuolar protein sorting-associated protein 4B [Zootermopsis nevadensis]
MVQAQTVVESNNTDKDIIPSLPLEYNCCELEGQDLSPNQDVESASLVRGLFQYARDNTPSIIFFDEVDSLLSERFESESESSTKMKSEFLIRMDGARYDNDGILSCLEKANHNLGVGDFEILAKMTQRYSGADICNVMQGALMLPLRQITTATHFHDANSKVRKKRLPTNRTQILTGCHKRPEGLTQHNTRNVRSPPALVPQQQQRNKFRLYKPC